MPEDGRFGGSSVRFRLRRCFLVCARRDHEAADQAPGTAANPAFKIPLGELAASVRAVSLAQEYGQGAKQREVASRVGFAHRTTVFVLGAVAAVMLAIFDAPVIASQLLQLVNRGLLRPMASAFGTAVARRNRVVSAGNELSAKAAHRV